MTWPGLEGAGAAQSGFQFQPAIAVASRAVRSGNCFQGVVHQHNMTACLMRTAGAQCPWLSPAPTAAQSRSE